MGSRVLHLTYKDGWLRNRIKLGHSCVEIPAAAIKADKTCELVPFHGTSGWCLDVRGSIYTTSASEAFQPLALLRTCRAVYVEVTHMIYTTNIIDFDFWDFAELNYWSSSINPSRLASIISLQMHCNVWFDLRATTTAHPVLGLINDFPGLDTWREVWQIVADEMPALRTLVVRLFMCMRLHPIEERMLLQPLAQIEGLEHLSVRRIVNKRQCLRSQGIDFRDY